MNQTISSIWIFLFHNLLFAWIAIKLISNLLKTYLSEFCLNCWKLISYTMETYLPEFWILTLLQHQTFPVRIYWQISSLEDQLSAVLWKYLQRCYVSKFSKHGWLWWKKKIFILLFNHFTNCKPRLSWVLCFETRVDCHRHTYVVKFKIYSLRRLNDTRSRLERANRCKENCSL